MEFNDAKKKKRTKFNTKGQFFLLPREPKATDRGGGGGG